MDRGLQVCSLRSRTGTRRLAAVALCSVVLAASPSVGAKVVDEPAGTGQKQALLPQIWHSDLDNAIALAAAEYRPVLVLFTSPDCGYCTKLKYGPLRDPEVVNLLRNFSLAEVDVSTSRDTALHYQIRGTPALMVLSSDGRVQAGVNGYIPTPQLVTMLKRAINPDYLRRQDTSFLEIIQSFDDGVVPSEKWPSIMLFLGEKERRKDLHDRILAMNPFPATNLVELLTNPRIAVRLGALEMLEELTGDTFGYDPWLDADGPDSNSPALARWRTWALKSTNEVTTAYAALTAQQLASYIQDLVSDNRDRSVRAMRMLEQGDPRTSAALADFLKTNPQLPQGARQRIREVQYSLHLPAVGGVKPSILAHRLVFGTLDVRLKTITGIQAGGRRVLPVLEEFLESPDPIVRETTVDALVAADGRRAVTILKKHLKNERDSEVIFAVLRGLGNINSKSGLDILTSFLSNPSEDLTIAALHSIGRLKSRTVARPVAACLSDPRWRVRVAALETAGKLSLSSHADDVERLLDDKDDFVRYSAVKALTTLSSKKAVGKLEEVFLREDDLKAPIVAAFGSMDVKLPDSFVKALENKPPELLLAVIQAMEDCVVDDLLIAGTFIQHKELDVACAALRLVARRGMKLPLHRRQVIHALESDKPELVLAALESISLDSEQISAHNLLLEDPLDIMPSDADASGAVRDILDAFVNVPTPAPPTAATNTSAAPSMLENILDAFAPPPGGSDTATGADVSELIKSIEKCMDPAGGDNIRFAAAILLARIGNAGVVDFFREGLDRRAAADRLAVASSLAKIAQENVLPILSALLNDPSESVRRAAAVSCFAHATSVPFIDAVFEALVKKDSRLAPHEVLGYQLRAVTEKPQGRRAARNWSHRLLKESDEEPLQNFALILLQRCWRSDDTGVITRFLDSKSPLQRRAAFHTLGRCDTQNFEKHIPAILNDPSEYVRMVLPHVYTPSSTTWLHYLDDTHFEEEHFYWSSYGSPASALSAGALDALAQLAHDPSPRVRVEAYFALLTNYRTFDLMAFIDTINSFPDRNAITTRIAGYLVSNYERLGRGFRVLIPYIEGSRYDASSLKRVRDHFHVTEDASLDDISFETRNDNTPLAATFVDAPAAADTNATPRRLRMVYFTSPGCDDCARAEKIFEHLREYLPELEIETHNMNKLTAKQLNEALSDRFGVPEKVRLVSPAVFAAAGYLIKNDISFSSLGDLLSRSAAMPERGWAVVEQQEIERAAESLGEKGAAMSLGVVIGAGLLDGVNPCAFATIIFLLSYLQVTRRRPAEIARVGIAFIVGVFCAYFALGLGLFEAVSGLDLLRKGGRLLDRAVAGVALILMVMNLRDGVLCLQGRMQEMTLQLPGLLKGSIHGVIRHGARHAHFVAAAFVVGVIVSFLELACTGQVYLPLIHYMLSTGKHATRAMWYLLMYNIAFIAPLIVVFILACFGLTNEVLSRFMKKHAAAVKFCTALLFLVLFVVLVFGNAITEAWGG